MFGRHSIPLVNRLPRFPDLLGDRLRPASDRDGISSQFFEICHAGNLNAPKNKSNKNLTVNKMLRIQDMEHLKRSKSMGKFNLDITFNLPLHITGAQIEGYMQLFNAAPVVLLVCPDPDRPFIVARIGTNFHLEKIHTFPTRDGAVAYFSSLCDWWAEDKAEEPPPELIDDSTSRTTRPWPEPKGGGPSAVGATERRPHEN